jgi:hypothetical protein
MQQSGVYKLVDPKSNTLVRARKRRTKREPIPSVGRGHAGWTMAR